MYVEQYDNSKFRGAGNALYVVKFIEQECPPLAWNMIAVKIMKHIVKENLNAVGLKDGDEFPDYLLTEINNLLQADYQTKLPIY